MKCHVSYSCYVINTRDWCQKQKVSRNTGSNHTSRKYSTERYGLVEFTVWSSKRYSKCDSDYYQSPHILLKRHHTCTSSQQDGLYLCTIHSFSPQSLGLKFLKLGEMLLISFLFLCKMDVRSLNASCNRQFRFYFRSSKAKAKI